MLVAIIPTSFHDLSSVRFILFLRSVREQSDIVVDVKVEERSRFPASFVDNEVVEGVRLWGEGVRGI